MNTLLLVRVVLDRLPHASIPAAALIPHHKSLSTKVRATSPTPGSLFSCDELEDVSENRAVKIVNYDHLIY
jgi:hypothetical protein